MMQHRNTPDAEYGLSPSQLIFGRPIRDFLPVKPGQFSPAEVWIDCRESREIALRNRFIRGAERWSTHTRDLKPLKPGMKVILQNQHGAGKIAKKWDRTGLIIDDLGHNKYRIRVDGSGRVTDRNRQFLRKFTPSTPTQPGPRPGNDYYPPEPVVEPAGPEITLQTPPVVSNPEPVLQPMPQTPERLDPPPVAQQTPDIPGSTSFSTPPTTPVADLPPRRSTRASRLPDRWGYSKF